MPGGVGRETALAKVELRRNLYRDYLQGGYTNKEELAARYGVSAKRIAKELDVVRQMLNVEVEEEARAFRDKLVGRLDLIVGQALQGFQRSRKDVQEISTRYDKRSCRDCKGSGKVEEKECEKCEGTGRVVEEIVTVRVQGQAGNPAFLKVASSVLVDIAKLKRVWPDGRGMNNAKDRRVLKEDLAEELEKQFAGADPEIMLEHRRVLIKLRESKKKGELEEEGKTIDAKFAVPDNEREED